MHKTRAAVLILFLASTLAFGGCLVRQQTGKDGKGPEITMDNSEISASIHAEESELLAGVTAYDKKDGEFSCCGTYFEFCGKRAAENQYRRL